MGGGGGVVVILLLLVVVDVISRETCSAVAVAHSAVVVVAVAIHHHSTSSPGKIRCGGSRDHGTFSRAVDADDFGSIGVGSISSSVAVAVAVRSIGGIVFVSSDRQREGRFFLVVIVVAGGRSRTRSRTVDRLHPRQIPPSSSRGSSNSRTIPHRILKIILHSTTITEFISTRIIRMDDMMIVISIHLTPRQTRRTFFLFRRSSTSSSTSYALPAETKARL